MTGNTQDKYAAIARTFEGRATADEVVRLADDNGLDPVRLLRAVARHALIPDFPDRGDPSG
jgi:hypothetical protein